tara:strand:+ start:55 stop:1542 length:1488 start_codon:yes stop_codon:yes gene_type:complete
MNILLISPKYDATIVAPHLGLGYLSSSLKKKGHKVKILDGTREEIKYNPEDWELVGVTAMSNYFPEACKDIEKAKSYGLKTIIGGAHIICDPEQSLIDSQANYAAIGEGERTMDQLASGFSPDSVEGLVYWENGKPKRSNPNLKKLIESKKMYTTKIGNQSRDFQINIDDFGEPDWDSINPASYPKKMPHGMIYKSLPLAPIITTRGCPYSCIYCSAPITAGKRMRYRDPVKVVDGIDMLIKKYGVKEIQIEDDNFTLKRKHVIAVCEEIIKRKIKIDWCLPNGVRIDKLDPEMLRLMKKSGCYQMSLGIESANQRILDLIKKRLNKDLVKNVVNEVKKAGIQAVGFFMVGFPTETKKEIKETIDFASSLNLDRANFTKAVPLPGTELYNMWIELYGKNKNIDWKSFTTEQFTADWAACSGKEIARLQTWGFVKFYLTKFRFLKLLFSLQKHQLITFTKRILKIVFNTNLYNRFINKKALNFKFINPATRKTHKD